MTQGQRNPKKPMDNRIKLALVIIGIVICSIGCGILRTLRNTIQTREYLPLPASELDSNENRLSGNDWPMFKGSLNHTGTADSVIIKNGGECWNFTAGGSIESSPAVVDGLVYFGSEDDAFYCVNGSTGELIWQYVTGGAVISSPAIASGCVYFGGVDRNFYCLNATDGDLIWNYTTGEKIIMAPTVSRNYVYFGNMYYLFCLNSNTGVQIWNYTTDAEHSSPAIVGNLIYFGTDFYQICCLDAITGQQIWMTTIDTFHYGSQYPVTSPAVAEGELFVGYANHIYNLNATTGTIIWIYNGTDAITSSPAVAGDRVYFGCEDYNFYCINATTGAFLWTWYGIGGSSSPAVAGGCVYEGGFETLSCLDAASGALLWSFSTKGWIISSPAVAMGYIYFGCDDKHLYCVMNIIPPIPEYVSIFWWIGIGVLAIESISILILYIRIPTQNQNEKVKRVITTEEKRKFLFIVFYLIAFVLLYMGFSLFQRAFTAIQDFTQIHDGDPNRWMIPFQPYSELNMFGFFGYLFTSIVFPYIITLQSRTKEDRANKSKILALICVLALFFIGLYLSGILLTWQAANGIALHNPWFLVGALNPNQGLIETSFYSGLFCLLCIIIAWIMAQKNLQRLNETPSVEQCAICHRTLSWSNPGSKCMVCGRLIDAKCNKYGLCMEDYAKADPHQNRTRIGLARIFMVTVIITMLFTAFLFSVIISEPFEPDFFWLIGEALLVILAARIIYIKITQGIQIITQNSITQR